MILNTKRAAVAVLTVAVSALASVTGGVTGGAASEIVLRLKEGGFEIAGKLAAFDGRIYRIETDAYGTLDLEAARFDCTGSDCGNRVAITAAAQIPLTQGSEKPASAEKAQRFAIHGSNTIGSGLMPTLIRAYAAKLEADVTQIAGTDPLSLAYRLRGAGGTEIVTIELQRRGSASAFPALANGAALIGMADRRILAPEFAALAAAFPQIRPTQHEHVLGLDGIAVIVAQENAVASLSMATLARIFAGEIKDWSELGLPKAPITVLTLDQNTGTSGIFDNLVLKPRGLKVSPAARQILANGDLADEIARDPHAIGFTAMAFVGNTRSVDVETTCGLPASPTPFALKTGEYPLARQLYLYTAAALEQPMARGFLQFALSSEAQTSVTASQFVDQSFDTADEKARAARMAFAARQPIAVLDAVQLRRLLAETEGARRLSATFRFAPASAELDAKSRQDLMRLSQHLQSQQMRAKSVMLLGFTDPIGGIPQNTALSLGRATQVRAALLAASGGALNPQTIAARGFGALAPVACSDTPHGLYLNRRVEVWVRD